MHSGRKAAEAPPRGAPRWSFQTMLIINDFFVVSAEPYYYEIYDIYRVNSVGPLVVPCEGSFIYIADTCCPCWGQFCTPTYTNVILYMAAEVSREVNLWAEKETNGLIKELLPPGSVDNSTRLIFANALYFKGAWNETFDSSKTKDNDFHLLNGGSVKVPFMTSKKQQLISAFNGFKVLGLPYKQGEDKRRFSMYFFLPDAKDGLPALVEKMGSGSRFLEQHLPAQKVEVGDFRIPRFKISFGFEVSTVLKRLGLVLPFSGEGGGLAEMVDSSVGRNLYISSIFQKSFIEVNEEGTEAAAASAAVIKLKSILHFDKIDFVADHPFVFVIREDMTGMVMFIGHLLNPFAG